MWIARGLLFFLAVLCLPLTAVAEAKPRVIFAAASLGEALEVALEDYPDPVVVSVAGSGTLARQIAQGAPADAVMLANLDWLDWLEERRLVLDGTRSAPIGNRLALVGPLGASLLPELTRQSILVRLGEDGRLAMGDHRAVPAGQYGARWLQDMDLWSAVRPRLAEVENVRVALTLVSRAEVPMAIVYQSDLVVAASRVTPVWTIPDTDQPDIRYGLAAVTPEGRDLANFLASAKARETFVRFGFRDLSP